MTAAAPLPSVFISYRQENPDFCRRVREFAEKLRAANIHVIHDGLAQDEQFHGNQPQNGWGLWSIQQASDAPSVIVFGSPGWYRVIKTPEPTPDGKGAAAEATCVFARLYSSGTYNDFAAMVFFDFDNDSKLVPPYFSTLCGRFDATKADHFDRLLKWLRRPSAAAPVAPVTSVAPLPVTGGPDFPAVLPQPDRSGFVDCRAAFEAFARLLDRDAKHRILLLEAEGEHGKSQLILRFFSNAQSALPPASTAFVGFDERILPPEHYLTEIADALNQPALAGDNDHARTRSLFSARAQLPTVIFVDGYDHALPEHADWLALFLRRTINQPLLRIVIAGRRVPAHDAQAWGLYAEHVHCDPLSDPDAFVQHAVARGSAMPAQEIAACCKFLRNRRDARKREGKSTDGFSPLALLGEIERFRPGGTVP